MLSLKGEVLNPSAMNRPRTGYKILNIAYLGGNYRIFFTTFIYDCLLMHVTMSTMITVPSTIVQGLLQPLNHKKYCYTETLHVKLTKQRSLERSRKIEK